MPRFESRLRKLEDRLTDCSGGSAAYRGMVALLDRSARKTQNDFLNARPIPLGFLILGITFREA